MTLDRHERSRPGIPQWTVVTLAHWGVLMFAEELRESASPEISDVVVNLDEVDLLEAHSDGAIGR